ncbi:MAG: Uma2 family endonuclease [Acidiphilium sp.]|nr:Uma2 family endonuclease [Acidiphilium sp.]MDD4937043.1 Uma2 family endonuclease [Acidiphilium sp.]
MSSAIKFPARMTVAEFLDWCPEDGQRWQLVDGEPVAMAPASTTHARIQAEIGRLLGNHLVERGSLCDVLTAPGVTPHLEKVHNVRVPDLGVSCASSGDDGLLLSEPVLLIEILSPSNHRETWANVWAYASISSVREILVVSSVSVGADLLRRRPDGTWPEQPETVTGGDLWLESIHYAAPLIDFYRTTRFAAGR